MKTLLALLMVAGMIGIIIIGIIMWLHFATMPVSELPAWALLFFR